MQDFKILYVDDDLEVRKIVKLALSTISTIDEASCLSEAYDLINRVPYGVILLDLNLGIESGFELIEFIKKKEFVFMPSIIIITASDKEEDEVRGHKLDICEYIKKPIKPSVLRAQIEKYCLKLNADPHLVKKVGPLKIDPRKMQVKIHSDSKEQDLLLTLKEYKLLLKFMENPGVTFSREQLFTEVWDSSSEIQSRTIDMHISGLRKKLGDFGNTILSIRGIGYSFSPERQH